MNKKLLLILLLFTVSGSMAFADLMYSKNFYENLQKCTPYAQDQIFFSVEIKGKEDGKCVVEEKTSDIITKQVKKINVCKFSQEQADEIAAAGKEPADKIISEKVTLPNGMILKMDNVHPATLKWNYYLNMPDVCKLMK
jgi:hypothetical protein